MSEPPRVPLQMEGATRILEEAAAVGRDTALLRQRMATYQARYASGQTLAQARQWLLSSVAALAAPSFRERDLADARVRAWAKDNPARIRHHARVSGRIRRSSPHTIHWMAGRYRRWLTLLGLPPSEKSAEPEPGSTSN